MRPKSLKRTYKTDILWSCVVQELNNSFLAIICFYSVITLICTVILTSIINQKPRDQVGSQGHRNQLVRYYTLNLWYLPCTMQLNVLG